MNTLKIAKINNKIRRAHIEKHASIIAKQNALYLETIEKAWTK